MPTEIIVMAAMAVTLASYYGRLGRPLLVPKQQVRPAGSWCAYPSRLACLMRDIGWRNFSMLPVLVVSDALGEHFSPPWNSAGIAPLAAVPFRWGHPSLCLPTHKGS